MHVAGASTCEIVRCEIRNNGCPGVWVDGEDSICMVRDTVISDNGSDGCVSVNGGHCVLNGAVKVQGNKGVGIGAEENGTLTIRTNEELGFVVEGNKGTHQRKEESGGKIVIEQPTDIPASYKY